MRVEERAGERLARVVRELREMPRWPGITVDAGLVIADCLAALGWSCEEIEGVVGFDPREYWEERVEMVEVVGR